MKKWLAIGSIVVIIVAFIAIAGNTNTGSKTTNADVNTNTNKTYQQVTTFTGKGSKNSEPFTIKGDRLRVKYECTGMPCYAKLRPVQKRPGFLWKDIFNTDKSTKDETIIYQSGEFYIEVVSSESFNIVVEDYK